MTISNTLIKAWEAVQRDSLNGDGYCSVRVFAASPFSIFIGRHTSTELIDFSFEVDQESIKKISLAQNAKGFDVVVQKALNGRSPKIRRVTIALNRLSFSDLFHVLAADILEHCLQAESEACAMEKLHIRLDHWRRFSEKAGGEGLGAEQQTGLFGELYFLKTILNANIADDLALAAWHGPLRDNQDFCFGAMAVEVKASVSNSAKSVSISNARQLDAVGLDELYLYHVSFDRRSDSGKTLPEAVSELLTRFRNEGCKCEDLFEDLLMLQGYHHSQSHLYSDVGYTKRGHDLYSVEEGFPRIVESELMDGVDDVCYKIDLACAALFKKELSQITQTLRENKI